MNTWFRSHMSQKRQKPKAATNQDDVQFSSDADGRRKEEGVWTESYIVREEKNKKKNTL